jgi:hypothetical protein
LVLKLLIAMYILFWIFFFQFHPLEFNFYINFGPYFYNFYLLFPYHFLIGIFYLSNLVLILLIVTYFIWNNLWNFNYYYFNFFIFQIEKNKILISYFPAHFPWHNQTLENIFQLIFHYTTKYQKIIHFSGIHFPKRNYFSANKRGLNFSCWFSSISNMAPFNFWFFIWTLSVFGWEGARSRLDVSNCLGARFNLYFHKF